MKTATSTHSTKWREAIFFSFLIFKVIRLCTNECRWRAEKSAYVPEKLPPLLCFQLYVVLMSYLSKLRWRRKEKNVRPSKGPLLRIRLNEEKQSSDLLIFDLQGFPSVYQCVLMTCRKKSVRTLESYCLFCAFGFIWSWCHLDDGEKKNRAFFKRSKIEELK